LEQMSCSFNVFSDSVTNALVRAFGVFASARGCVLGAASVCADVEGASDESVLSEGGWIILTKMKN